MVVVDYNFNFQILCPKNKILILTLLRAFKRYEQQCSPPGKDCREISHCNQQFKPQSHMPRLWSSALQQIQLRNSRENKRILLQQDSSIVTKRSAAANLGICTICKYIVAVLRHLYTQPLLLKHYLIIMHNETIAIKHGQKRDRHATGRRIPPGLEGVGARQEGEAQGNAGSDGLGVTVDN
ncbi:Hypothetical_protein [Hexamita inflata]|uniref:Hypothetical_protein n=1 Tax=Hexamita inflata TaxID=28002 RepID=A0ABP1HPE4_9EUKA